MHASALSLTAMAPDNVESFDSLLTPDEEWTRNGSAQSDWGGVRMDKTHTPSHAQPAESSSSASSDLPAADTLSTPLSPPPGFGRSLSPPQTPTSPRLRPRGLSLTLRSNSGLALHSNQFALRGYTDYAKDGSLHSPQSPRSPTSAGGFLSPTSPSIDAISSTTNTPRGAWNPFPEGPSSPPPSPPLPSFFDPEVVRLALHHAVTAGRMARFAQGRKGGFNMDFIVKVDEYARALAALTSVMSSISSAFTGPTASTPLSLAPDHAIGLNANAGHFATSTLPMLEGLYRDAQAAAEERIARKIYPEFVKHQLSLCMRSLLSFSGSITTGRFKPAYPGLGDAFCLTDPSVPDNPITFASEGLARVFGYARYELISHNCRIFQGPLTDDAAVGRLRRAISAGQEASELVVSYRRDRSFLWTFLFLFPLRDPDTDAVRYWLGGHINVSSGSIGPNPEDFLRILNYGASPPGAMTSHYGNTHGNTLTGGIGSVASTKSGSDLRRSGSIRRSSANLTVHDRRSERVVQTSSRRSQKGRFFIKNFMRTKSTSGPAPSPSPSVAAPAPAPASPTVVAGQSPSSMEPLICEDAGSVSTSNSQHMAAHSPGPSAPRLGPVNEPASGTSTGASATSTLDEGSENINSNASISTAYSALLVLRYVPAEKPSLSTDLSKSSFSSGCLTGASDASTNSVHTRASGGAAAARMPIAFYSPAALALLGLRASDISSAVDDSVDMFTVLEDVARSPSVGKHARSAVLDKLAIGMSISIDLFISADRNPPAPPHSGPSSQILQRIQSPGLAWTSKSKRSTTATAGKARERGILGGLAALSRSHRPTSSKDLSSSGGGGGGGSGGGGGIAQMEAFATQSNAAAVGGEKTTDMKDSEDMGTAGGGGSSSVLLSPKTRKLVSHWTPLRDAEGTLGWVVVILVPAAT